MTKIIEGAYEKSKSFSVAPNTRTPGKPEYISAPGDTVLSSENNSFIVLGKDRVGPPGSGNDIKAINSAAITLCAGLGTAIKNSQIPLTARTTLSRAFYYDSAVLYISEQTDVDKNFLYNGESDKSTNSSAIALKADELRLFARGQVKIVTGMDQFDKGAVVNDPEAPSHPKRDFSGISLVANNNDVDMQPLVKGSNLEDFLNKLLDELEAAYGMINRLFDAQSKINEVIRNHTHLSDFTGAPLLINTDVAMVTGIDINQGTINQLSLSEIHNRRVSNIENMRKNYLQKNPKSYINSMYNKTN